MIKLEQMGMPQLRQLARDNGIKLIQHEGREGLLDRLSSQITDIILPKILEKSELTGTSEIEKALEFATKKGVEISFNEDDKTWHAKYMGAEDSGSLSMPLKIIIRKVELITRGAFVVPSVTLQGEKMMRC